MLTINRHFMNLEFTNLYHIINNITNQKFYENKSSFYTLIYSRLTCFGKLSVKNFVFGAANKTSAPSLANLQATKKKNLTFSCMNKKYIFYFLICKQQKHPLRFCLHKEKIYFSFSYMQATQTSFTFLFA